jgi:type II restriction enzyme
LATIEEAREILEALGMPSPQTNRMSGLTLLALCGLRPDDPWSVASRTGCTVTKSIMSHVSQHYDIEYAPNTRETFRRLVLHQFIQGGIRRLQPI